jgi:hypothetical protein
MDQLPFKLTVICPRCNKKVYIEGAMSMAVGLVATQVQRLGCDDCQKAKRDA